MKYGARRLAGGLILAAVAAVPMAWAAGMFSGWPFAGASPCASCVATLPLTGNEGLAADTQLPSGLNPASELISVDQINQGTQTTNSSATSATATAAQMSGGAKVTLLLTGAPSSAQTLTTPTAALLLANLPTQSQVIGKSWLLKIVNVGGTSSGVWTVAGGTNVTVTGNATVAVAGSRTYLATITAVATPAITLQDYGN